MQKYIKFSDFLNRHDKDYGFIEKTTNKSEKNTRQTAIDDETASNQPFSIQSPVLQISEQRN